MFESRPPMEDIAELNLKTYQIQSDLDNMLHISGVPMLAFYGFPTSAEEVSAGPGEAIAFPADGRAEYINFSRRTGFKSIVFTGEDLVAREGDFETALRVIIEGIRGGDFHPEPSNRECRYCDFNTLCDSAKFVQADRKADDPLVQRFRTLWDIS
jgi:hypothetical protein